MLSVTFKHFILSVIMLSVVMKSVVMLSVMAQETSGAMVG
jgi:hypothetical protein